jgi:glycosyltransferase involved in cell wall biosynthesis
MIEASIIVATYNRKVQLERLLATLAKQTLPREQYEVVVIDDGSRDDATPTAKAFENRIQVVVLRQANAGVAVARQRGVEKARGRIVIFLDDDMLAAGDFVEQHVEAHAASGRDDLVVMGELLPDERLEQMPLFERYHAYQLAKAADAFSTSGFAGHDVYTGNLSLPRELFFRAGGFDPTFHIEDVELGVRLEKVGARFVFSRRVATVHASDHTSLESWLARSIKDGRDWVRLIRKHPDVHAANPWRYLGAANPLARPFFVAAVLLPRAATPLSRVVFRGAASAAALGLEQATASAMTLVYGIQYFGGVREEAGSLRSALKGYLDYRRAGVA